MTHSLEIESVILRFGDRTILQDVCLRCETGRVTGLLGLNGSGKSSLMRIATGELRAEQQFVRIDDRVLLTSRRQRGDIAFMPQHHFIPWFLTAKRVLRDYGIDAEMFTSCFPELTGRMNHLSGEMSGGERRLLEFLVVVCGDAKFALLDEPFSHVMPVNIATMTKLIREESQRKGILVSDHLHRHVTDVCDDLYLVADGCVRRVADSAELVRHGYLREISG